MSKSTVSLFEEAVTIFADPLSMNMPDLDHPASERRYVALGLSDRYRFLVVCYAEIAERTRIISARQPPRSETKSYEEG
ncbi:MAG TPA: BrnT family toxin [Terriglobia bacterium]|jgi:hypothetical protein